MTTWADALRDQSIPIHWLLEIDAGGPTWRFADRAMNVGDHPYIGALEVNREPELQSDPYQGEVGVVAAVVYLKPVRDGGAWRPLFRPHDIADTFAEATLVGLVARLYLWAEGTALTERQVRIDGHITTAIVRREDDLELEISDFSARYSRMVLPPIVVDTDLWTDADEDDVGRRAPIVYGTFTRLEVPCIDNPNDRHIIGHHIGSVTGGRVDTTSETPTLTNVAAADPLPAYAQLEYPTSNTNNVTVLVHGTGALDDADGTYSGTASALLVHTADQLHHLAREIVGIPADKIDAAAFVTLREKTVSHKNTLLIAADDAVNYFQVCTVALMPYRGGVFAEHGMLTARVVDFTSPPRYALRENEKLLGLEEVEWSDYEMVPAGIEIKYSRKWNRKKNQYKLSLTKSVAAADFPPFLKSQGLGAEKLVLEFPFLADSETADLLVAGLKELYEKPRRRARAIVSRECHDVLLFDSVTVSSSAAPSENGAGWSDKKFVVIGVTYGAENSTLTLLEV